MKIVIIGAGKVGSKIASQLASENHDIVVIDQDEKIIEEIGKTQDVQAVLGNAAEYKTQIEAGVKTADLVVACTDSDELNMLCCLMCKKHGAARTIARVRSPEYREQLPFISKEMGLSMDINPEMAAAEAMSRILIFPAANSIETFAKGRVELIEFTLDEGNPLIGLSLVDIHKKYSNNVLICAVQSGDDVLIPGGSTVLKRADRIYVASTHQNIHDFFREIGILETPVRNVMIVGGGKVAYYLAAQLIKHRMKVTVIEQNRARCEELSEQLNELKVINADGSDQETLEREGIGMMDAFASLTGIDEINIILSLYAKSRNVRKVIPKVTQIDFTAMLDDLGIESPISPKDVTANGIIRYVRALHNSKLRRGKGGSKVESVSFLVGGRVEALEFIVEGDSDFLEIPLRDLIVTKGCLVACIVRRSSVIIPDGNDVIRKGDDVIIVTTNSQMQSLEQIIKVKA